MPGQDREGFAAQLVMRREDGRSILDSGSSGGAVSPARAAEIRGRLAAMGFTVAAGNLDTLSLTGPPALFAEAFGLVPGVREAARIPEALRPFVAAVFVPPPPQFLP